jgi:hypothetical protein
VIIFVFEVVQLYIQISSKPTSQFLERILGKRSVPGWTHVIPTIGTTLVEDNMPPLELHLALLAYKRTSYYSVIVTMSWGTAQAIRKPPCGASLSSFHHGLRFEGPAGGFDEENHGLNKGNDP